MTIKERLTADMKRAMKAKDPIRLSTIRLVQAEIKNAEIRKKEALDDDEVMRVVARELKKRRESIGLFEQGGRQDLVEKETLEANILEEYLPAPLSEDDIKGLVDDAISATGAAGVKDMGRVMGALRPKITGRADGGAVSRIVRERLETA